MKVETLILIIVLIFLIFGVLCACGFLFWRSKESYISLQSRVPYSNLFFATAPTSDKHETCTVHIDGFSMGTFFEKSQLPLKAILPGDHKDLPESFNKWQELGYILPPRDQKTCGSCWAFSISSLLQARLCLITCGKWRYEFSPQFLIACDDDENSCGGSSSLYRVFKDMSHGGKLQGIYREIDYPYTGKEDGCKPPKGARRYDFLPGSIVTLSESNQVAEMTSEELDRNIVRIKKDILDNGPVSAAMIVYNDFLHYKGGVYEHPHGSTDKPVGGHAVTIQGWGKDDNGEYWICKNSWGTKWGLQGFWHHRIGDASLIESNCHSGLPDTRSQFHPIVGELAEKCNRHFVPVKGDGDGNNKS